jgi:hypothetical protein
LIPSNEVLSTQIIRDFIKIALEIDIAEYINADEIFLLKYFASFINI